MSNSTSPSNDSSSDDLDLNLYFYSPSTAAAVVFSVLYATLALWHGYINFISTRRHAAGGQKHKYTIPLFVACVISTAGWAVRIASIDNVSSIPLYAVSASYIVISPIFVCATLYLLLTRLIRWSLPSEGDLQIFLGISPRWIGRIFITSDVFSFLTQCSGSGIASSGNWEGNLKTVGTNVLLVGLCLQLATFTVFLAVLWMFGRRVASTKEAAGLDPCVKKVVFGVWLAGFFVQVRSIYRVVEFAMGVDGYLFKHEWCLYVFEAVPMFVALAVLAFYHPVRWMRQQQQQQQQKSSGAAEFAMQDSYAHTSRSAKVSGGMLDKGGAVA
ncbi:putative RTA1 domain protein [Cladophialophora carrionii]|uniref:Putative RTA1 domain protein n=1 Tax=Cladophialophora carrionii TaxID=86049 RepID=A0A1C1CKG4_9EURO|nr:putative RTA1 domain protein [Cladophialophora carrionii]